MFEQFDEKPLAAASIAQVHVARLRSGEDVVVKVMRPGVRERIERDLEVMHVLARLALDYSPRATGCGRSRSCASTRRRSSTSST